MIYEKGEVVSATKCDINANLSLIGAVELIQDNICFYFGDMHIDQITMKNQYNAIWMYTKNKIRLKQDLTWNDKFLIRCFISQITPVRLVVDTVFVKDENIALYSKVELCLYDLEKQKLKRIMPDILGPYFICQASQEEYTYDKLLFNLSEFSLVDEVKVKAGNIDYCVHTNNIEYLRFTLNTLEVKTLKERRFKEVEIHYLSQTKEHDLIQIYQNQNDNTHDFLIKHENKDIIKCRMLTEEKGNFICK